MPSDEERIAQAFEYERIHTGFGNQCKLEEGHVFRNGAIAITYLTSSLTEIGELTKVHISRRLAVFNSKGMLQSSLILTSGWREPRRKKADTHIT